MWSLPSIGPIFPLSNPLNLLVPKVFLLLTLTSSSPIPFIVEIKNLPAPTKSSEKDLYLVALNVFDN